MVGTTSIAMYLGYPRVAVGFLWLAGITWRQRSIPMVSSLRTSSFQCCAWFPFGAVGFHILYLDNINIIYYIYIYYSYINILFIHFYIFHLSMVQLLAPFGAPCAQVQIWSGGLSDGGWDSWLRYLYQRSLGLECLERGWRHNWCAIIFYLL
jgi:hypothetical protein